VHSNHSNTTLIVVSLFADKGPWLRCIHGLILFTWGITAGYRKQRWVFIWCMLQRTKTYMVKNVHIQSTSKITHKPHNRPIKSGKWLTSLYHSDTGKLYFGHYNCDLKYLVLSLFCWAIIFCQLNPSANTK
jgi:hypothetical protein